ncbi:SPOR domain-containing protein [Shewanella avicenniae]|uniref:SPOR domain-containing protein n=1 Tax=Shewanella avicenniae TaxID=2814294 RepID=A0ABX7QP50_9GAMM|nr:SPOR domain-containing protein [Shewanella avicenniae]QSX33257.1 SPOR domain-containing protein [Shewanella avicenniae]
MRSDYANSKPRQPRKRGANSKSKATAAPRRPVSPIKFVVGLAVLVGFIYALWFLKHDGTDAASGNEPQAVTTKAAAPATTNPKDTLPPKPKEEWTYQKELENKQVEVDVPAQSNQPSRPYQMQCGSFRKESQAQEMKAVIAFQGIEAQVRKVGGNNGDWFKVILGPYDAKRQAERDRHTLQRVGLNGCMIWLWTN